MTVLVVGGGITGLASAHALGRAGVPTILVEGGPRLGGKARTAPVRSQSAASTDGAPLAPMSRTDTAAAYAASGLAA